MSSERVLEVPVCRHVIDTGRPFSAVLDGIFGLMRFLQLDLDTEVLGLLRQVAGAPTSGEDEGA